MKSYTNLYSTNNSKPMYERPHFRKIKLKSKFTHRISVRVIFAAIYQAPTISTESAHGTAENR